MEVTIVGYQGLSLDDVLGDVEYFENVFTIAADGRGRAAVLASLSGVFRWAAEAQAAEFQLFQDDSSATILGGLYMESAMSRTRLPVFGSPPRDWMTLGQAVTSSGASSAFILGTQHSAVASLIVVAGNLFYVTVAAPVVSAGVRGLTGLVDDYFIDLRQRVRDDRHRRHDIQSDDTSAHAASDDDQFQSFTTEDVPVEEREWTDRPTGAGDES